MRSSRHIISRFQDSGDPLKVFFSFIVTSLIIVTIIASLVAVTAEKPNTRDRAMSLRNDSYTIGVQAYIYGLAPVIMERTEQVMTTTPGTAHAPINQFGHARRLATPNDTDVVTPNSDTLYSSAWLDLGKEPIVLHVPDTGGRYYVMQMIDAYTNTFAYVGRRTTGTGEGDFAIIGPGWSGSLPAHVKEIHSPTNTVWIIGRILVNGSNDIVNVTALQDQLTLTPLSQFGMPAGTQTPPSSSLLKPSADAQDQLKFFEELRVALKNNPPPEGEAALMAVFDRIGLGMNRTPYGSDIDPAMAEGLALAIPTGRQIVNDTLMNLGGDTNNGWTYALDIGAYGYDYLTRAAVAEGGLGANLPVEAVYPKARTDSDGQPLSGASRYVIHFPAGKTPPVDAFWSISMYNASSFMLVANPIDRYAIGDRTQGLAYNADGSLDIYIQHDAPPERSNWLPAPEGDFYLVLRMYQPKPQVLNGTYQIPPIKKIA